MSEVREAVVVLYKGGKVHKTYGIRTEKLSGKRWNILALFPGKKALESGKVMTRFPYLAILS